MARGGRGSSSTQREVCGGGQRGEDGGEVVQGGGCQWVERQVVQGLREGDVGEEVEEVVSRFPPSYYHSNIAEYLSDPPPAPRSPPQSWSLLSLSLKLRMWWSTRETLSGG